jgi:hypothetical protein
MVRIFVLLIGFFLEGAVKRLLLGAGLALVSAVSIQTFFDQKINQALSQTGYMDNWILGLMAVAKFDICLSIVLSAVAARVVISSASLTLSKIK